MPATQENEAAKTLAILEEWFKSHRVVYDEHAIQLKPNVRGAVADGPAFGVIAKMNLLEGDTVCTISKDAVVSVKNCGIADIIEEAEIGGVFGLAFALMYELSLGARSPWSGYLQSLPQRENLPMFWSDQDLEELNGTDLGDDIVADKALLLDDYETMILPIINDHPEAFPDKSLLTFEHFLNATSLVTSRAFQVDEYHGDSMVPLADIFNHKTGAEHVHFETDTDVCPYCGANGPCWCTGLDDDEDEDGNWEDVSDADEGESDTNTIKKNIGIENGAQVNGATESEDADDEVEERTPSLYDPDEWVRDDEEVDLESFEENPLADTNDVLEMTVVRPCKTGEEVFNTYGNHSNAALLNRYGFAEEENPFDEVKVSMDDIVMSLEGKMPLKRIQERQDFWNLVARRVVEDFLSDNGAGSESEDEPESENDEDKVDDDETSEGSSVAGSEDEEDSSHDNFHFTSTGQASPTLFTFLHILYADPNLFSSLVEDVEKLQRYVAQLASGGWTVKSVTPASKANRRVGGKVPVKAAGPSPLGRAVSSTLLWLAEKRSARYTTGIQEDKKRLRTLPEGPSNLRWALILRIGEKAALAQAVKRYSSFATPLGSKRR
ncbi:protein-lysine N-methyltransferase [Spizellomyces punctatus DAOM BR117]|uniref:Rubisco LSMT substrate-binding domain-containing protein n=1 Tax=Spizellomyces punctatus (strain DAOM BR117) TaxID=645134 RepID=A0A0L0HNR8_SPIPD|nr:protein-lysine N-methyltransferase [Spizellomyces punctatus DAOM BR117]KND02469.1 hypothetical protein SPPG_02931 [Spizellomyces punctatus DAOM BR117]|eukprot:XP_016610508.1 hypothetical protein SPPG_02931 [Spizellomyces punctatus DAOM BR117]